jgi:hypothetical protein
MSETTQYRFRVTQSGDVEVTSEGETLELQLRSVSTLPLKVWRSPKEWVATGCNGHTRSVRRSRRFPVPQFVIANGSETLATIQCTHLLRTRYVISLAGGATWVFRMPLFPSGPLGFFRSRSLTLREGVARKPLGSLC